MVASVGTILIAPGDGDMRVYLEQLERLAALDAHLALPAHGEPIEQPTALFHHYVVHRMMRENKVLAAVVQGGVEGSPLDELLSRAYDDVPEGTWPIAVLSLQAHLAKLAEEGRVRIEVREGERSRYIAGE
jgi:glyoxylase-like metal-dependent hydrolase (beta-lactamase superfamily II)